MKWDRVSAYCIRSGTYRIARYTLGAVDVHQVHHGDRLLGEADNGNAARRIAEAHSKRVAE